MKKNLLKDMAGKNAGELEQIIAQEFTELKKLVLYKTVKRPKNTREIFTKRKKIAQLKTLLREKELNV